MFAAVEIDPNIILPTLITVVGTVVVAWLGLEAKRRGDEAIQVAREVHTEVRTNHGMRSGEYLEIIHDKVSLLSDKVDVANAKIDVVDRKLDDHTERDERQFSEIRERIESFHEPTTGLPVTPLPKHLR